MSGRGRAQLAAALALGLAGCAPAAITPHPKAQTVGTLVFPDASFSGHLVLPASVPGPVAGVPVRLTLPGGQAFTINGTPVVTVSDAAGAFAFPPVVAAAAGPVVVEALLAGGRHLEALVVPQPGANPVDLSVATTVSMDFLLQQDALYGQPLPARDLTKLAAAQARVQALLDQGSLPPPDLLRGDRAVAHDQLMVALGGDRPLSNLWTAVLGGRPVALGTLAGTGAAFAPGGSTGDGGPAAAAALAGPAGLAVAADGSTYLGEDGEHRVRRLAPDGTLTTFAGAPYPGDPAQGPFPVLSDGVPAGSAGLPHPVALAVDAQGDLFVADGGDAFQGGQVAVVAAATRTAYGVALQAGSVARLAGLAAGGFSATALLPDGGKSSGRSVALAGPTGLAIDPAGNVYVAERLANRVLRLDPSGNLAVVAGSSAGSPARGGTPTPALVDGPAASATFADPTGLAYRDLGGGSGELYVYDAVDNAIRRIAVAGGTPGAVDTVAGSGPAGIGFQDGPAASALTHLGDAGPLFAVGGGLAVSASGSLAFVDAGNSCVRVLAMPDPSRPVATVAGATASGRGADPRDGDARQALLLEPYGLAWDASGNLLVADHSDQKVRKVFLQWGR